MAGYQTTYSAGMSRTEIVDPQVDPTHNHPFDPADELSVAPTEADVATPHPSAADKPVEERWPIPAPPPGYQGESYVATVGPDGVTVFVPPTEDPNRATEGPYVDPFAPRPPVVEGGQP